MLRCIVREHAAKVGVASVNMDTAMRASPDPDKPSSIILSPNESQGTQRHMLSSRTCTSASVSRPELRGRV